jgi:hypothetical protein
VGLGRLECEWNELRQAERRLTRHLEASHRWGDEQIGPGPQLLIDGYRALARILQARGEGAGAWAMLDRAEQAAVLILGYRASREWLVEGSPGA